MSNQEEYTLESVELHPRKLGWNVVAVAVLAGSGKLLANLIITGNALNGHIDAACAVNPNCAELILNIAKLLPALVPGIFYIAKGAVLKNSSVSDCSDNPDGGANKSITGKYE
jgi:hypothetical protein